MFRRICTKLAILSSVAVLSAAALAWDDLAERDLAAPAVRLHSASPFVATQVLVRLAPNGSVAELAGRYLLRPAYRFVSDPRLVVFEKSPFLPLDRTLDGLRRDWQVSEANPVENSPRVRWQFVPNDPFFPKNAPNSAWPGQWYLVNQHVSGRDAGLQAAWNANRTGSGVVIGIVDDGLQTNHPDLAANYASGESFDFGEGNAVPNPVYSGDNHGTAVAGVAAARGGNAIGITGAAPLATLAGLRVDFEFPTDAMFGDAALFRSSGATRTIKIKNHSYGIGSTFVPNATENNAVTTSSAAGTIHVFAAGNSRGGSVQDVNKVRPQNNPGVITVAALASDGRFAEYSAFGAPIVCTAPSSGSAGMFDVVATDRTGAAGYNPAEDDFPNQDYVGRFGGTSASAPLVAGVLGIVKQVKPTLDARFAKHLLVRTCKVVDPTDATEGSDGGWKTNGAGVKFNQNYGFGLIDAGALVAEAANWSGVTTQVARTTGTVNVNAAIPDNNPTGISRTFTIAQGGKLEEVLITLNVTHTYRGDLEGFLTSPSGTTGRLFIRSGSDGAANFSWTFCSNAFWGENAQGTWTLKLSDAFEEETGTWNSFSAELRTGELVPATFPVTGTITLQNFSGGAQNVPVTFEIRTAGTTTVLETYTLNPASNGAYTVPSTRQGTFDLTAKASHWLRAKLTNVVIGSNGVSGQNFTLKNGDVNGDNSVNLADFLALRSAFGSSSGGANWNPNADLDGSGAVNVADFVILRSFFGQSGAA
ncbi:MAG: S8 family serine peptidase [Fimbriimonadaceae bacterium]|nr:S8 family serine peptidase [Fimbriimonadaceae bacterium]